MSKNGITEKTRLIKAGIDKEIDLTCDKCGKTKSYRVVNSISRTRGEAWEARHGDSCRR